MLSIMADSRFLYRLGGVTRRMFSLVATDCPLCEGRAAGGGLCAGCRDDITQTMQNAGYRCTRCAQRMLFGGQACQGCADMCPVFTQAIAAFDYEPPFDSLIGRYKAEHRFGLSTTLAQLLAGAIARAGGIARTGSRSAPCQPEQVEGRGTYALKASTVLIPIPSSSASLRRRGFNPAAELAASLGACLQLPVRRGALRRLREGPRQAYSGRQARQRGAQGLFACVAPVQGLSIGLVDDVMTTGSTVNAAAHALLRAGAADVTVLVAARTPVRDRHA
ncbi:ComF family protein [Bordetella tumbae]|uniref:ComF family protein n=1 Tax=Bordetella tumbae TaxID=1649139 RepID=UPI0039F11546